MVENAKLNGNEAIEQAIASFADDRCDETIWALISAIQNRLAENGHFLIPIEYPAPDNYDKYALRPITNDDGETYMACFTSEEELRKGPETGIRIAEGKLTLEGVDFGSECQTINGKDEYEYHITLDEDNTKRLLCQLRIDHGLEIARDKMFKTQFGGDAPSTALMEYCKNRQIKYEFASI